MTKYDDVASSFDALHNARKNRLSLVSVHNFRVQKATERNINIFIRNERQICISRIYFIYKGRGISGHLSAQVLSDGITVGICNLKRTQELTCRAGWVVYDLSRHVKLCDSVAPDMRFS